MTESTLVPAKTRLEQFIELHRSLLAHGDIPKSYLHAFQRVQTGLNQKALTELLNAGK